MGNQIKEFQGYVLESAFRSKRIPFKQYAEMSIKLFDESNLNLHQILLLQGHIQKNRKEADKALPEDMNQLHQMMGMERPRLT